MHDNDALISQNYFSRLAENVISDQKKESQIILICFSPFSFLQSILD